MQAPGIAGCFQDDIASEAGYSRACPFGCVDQGLYSLIYFLPGQAMRPHRHLDSDEYFTALVGDAEMYVNGRIVTLLHGHTFLRRRGVLHAIRNGGSQTLIIQSFQSPIPAEDMTRWESVPDWGLEPPAACPRCWCGQISDGRCENCNAPIMRGARAV